MSQNVTHIIQKDRHGNVKEDRPFSVPLTSDEGESESLAMSQKAVTEIANELREQIGGEGGGSIRDAIDEIDGKVDGLEQKSAQAEQDIAALQEGLADAGKVDDVEVNGVSALNPATKKVSLVIPTSASAEATDNEPGTPTATAEMVGTDIHFTLRNFKGDKGDPLRWDDLTEGQKASLKGEQGDSVIVQEGDLPLANTLGNSSIKAISQKIVTDVIDDLDDEIYKRTPDGYSETEIDITDKIISDSKTIDYLTGVAYTSSNYVHTDFIDISEFTRINYGKATRTADGRYKVGIAFYSSPNEEGFIRGVESVLAESIPTEYVDDTVDVPEGAKYVRIPVFSDPNAEEQYLYGLKPAYQKASKIAALEVANAEMNGDLYKAVPTGSSETSLDVSTSTITSGNAINYQSGEAYPSGSYSASGYIDISEYDEIIYGRAQSPNDDTYLGIAFYSEANEGSSIRGQQAKYNAGGMVGYVPQSIVKPKNANYVRLSINNDTTSYGYPILKGVKHTYAKRSKLASIGKATGEVVRLTQRDICYGYHVDAFGVVRTNNYGFGCTSYVCCKGASELTIKKAITTNTATAKKRAAIAFYDVSKECVGYELLTYNAEADGMELVTIDIPEGACYLRATYWDGENIPNDAGEFYAEFASDEAATNGKREAVGDYIYFTVPVNQAVDEFWDNGYDESKLAIDMKDTTGVLLLPSSYSKNGEKTKLIVYFHGWSHYVKYGEWGNGNAGFLEQKQYWASKGFAVMDCNNWRHDLESGQSGLGSRQSMEAYRKCFEWVKANFNIDERPYIVCGSAGGVTGINCTYSWSDVRAAVWLDCWLKLSESYNSWSVAKSYFPELFGFANTTDWEEEKVKNYNPYQRVFEIGSTKYAVSPQCPIKVIWLKQGYQAGFYDALSNGGGRVSIRQVNLGSYNDDTLHSIIVSGGTDLNDPTRFTFYDEVIAFLQSF